MSKFKTYKEYVALSDGAYTSKLNDEIDGYTTKIISPVNSSGFQAIIYQKGTEKVLAIRGKKLNLKNLI